MFYRRGLIETWGSGTLKIVALMQDAGLAAPALRVGDDFATMTFLLPQAITPSKKSSEKILQHLKIEPGLSAQALAYKLGIRSGAVEKQINQLKKQGRLERIGPAKGGYWSVIE